MFFWLALLAACYLGLFPQAVAQTGDSGCGRFMCINATLNDNTVTYQLTGLRDPLGWLAIGFGHRMKDTHMVIMWSNDDGSTTLSQRFATGHHEPHPVTNPPRIATVDPSIASWHPSSNTSFAFTIPANLTLLTGDKPSETLIWAYSMSRPAKAPDSVLKPHYMAGFFNLDLTKPLAKSLETDAGGHKNVSSHANIEVPGEPDGNGQLNIHERIIVVHAAFLSVGFLVLLPLGALIGRWARTFTPVWFKVHRILNMALSMPVIIIGTIAAPVAIINRGGDHLVDQHEVYGVLLGIAYFLQIFIGRHIHARKHIQTVATPRAHPPLNIFHVALGLSIIGCAFLQVRSGFNKWEIAMGGTPVPRWVRYAWSSWLATVSLAYIIGLCLLRRQLYQEAQSIHGDAVERDNYVSLPNDSSSADSRLLVDEEDGDDDKVTDDDKRSNTRR